MPSDDESAYTPNFDYERLEQSAKIHRQQDKEQIQKALAYLDKSNQEPPYAVLDAGCGYGTVTKNRFGNNDLFNVTAIDEEPAVISVAKNRYNADNIYYEIDDVQNLDPDVHGRYSLVFSSYLLHHLNKDGQKQALAKMWSVTKPGGVLLARSCDDGQHFSYPNDDFSKNVVQATHTIPESSDRKQGRRLYNWARHLDPEPNKVSFDITVYDNVSSLQEERERYWNVFHSNRLHYAKMRANRDGATPQDKKRFERMKRDMEEARRCIVEQNDVLDSKTVPMLFAGR